MCKIFNIHRPSYYKWLCNNTGVNKIDEKLNSLVKSIFYENKSNLGSKSIKDRLLAKYGLIVSIKKIRRIMNELNLKVKFKKKYKTTTDSNHDMPIAPNHLNQDFYANNSNEKYVGDITYIPTKQGWLYLATVIDLYSRKIVGWSMDSNMKTKLVNDALEMAITHRNPNANLLWHTDRGSQYASYSHRALLKQYNITQSMSRKGNCWDNAVAESFFKTLKTELVYQTVFKTRNEAKQAIFKYIEFYYNRIRPHSYLKGLSPVEFEEKMEMLQSRPFKILCHVTNRN